MFTGREVEFQDAFEPSILRVNQSWHSHSVKMCYGNTFIIILLLIHYISIGEYLENATFSVAGKFDRYCFYVNLYMSTKTGGYP